MTNNKNNEPRTVISTGYEVEIKNDSQVEVLEGVGKNSNKPYKIVKQEAWLHQGFGYPVRCFIPLESEQDEYPEGAYFIGDLLATSGFGDLIVDNRSLKLVLKVDHKKLA